MAQQAPPPSSETKELHAGGISKSLSPTPQQRKEIRDLTEIEKYLFFEGLARFQNVDSTRPDSYYEISGIHGLPYRKWPNRDWMKIHGRKANWAGDFGGFCTHSSIIFLTWHRPYLALFESKLYDHVKAIAAGIPDGAEYVKAAQNFRLPYWDWARRFDRNQKPVPAFPAEALPNFVVATPPSGPSSASVQHQYQPLAQAPLPRNSDPGLFVTRTPVYNTIRQPGFPDLQVLFNTGNLDWTEDGRSSAAPDVSSVNRNLSERVANILNAYSRFGPMSYNLYRNPTSRVNDAGIWGSFEDIHNTVHAHVGGGGQMSDPAKAAFDPIFWLHHCNIDRMLAIWTGIHEDPKNPLTWVSDQAAGSNFLTTSREKEGLRTPLYPFWDENTQWYTSQNVKRTEDFNYTYPETDGVSSDPTTRAQEVRKNIRDVYLTPARAVMLSKRQVPSAGAQLLPQVEVLKQLQREQAPATHQEAQKILMALPEPQTLLQRSLEPSKPFLRDLAPDNKFLDWIVNIKGEKHAFHGQYTVSVFLGPVEENDVAKWTGSPFFVGSFFPFGQAQTTGCAKCHDDQAAGIQVTGQIPLTLALMERYLAHIIPDLTPPTVVPYLRENLHWRLTYDGRVVEDRSQVPGLTVFVISNEVTVPEDDNQPVVFAEDVTIHADITTSRDGLGRGNGTGLARNEL